MRRIGKVAFILIIALSMVACSANEQEQGTVSDSGSRAQSTAITETVQSSESVSTQPNDNASSESEQDAQPVGTNTLVVFFSRQNNAANGPDAVTSASLSSHDATVLADMIQQYTKGDLFQIITENAYPAAYKEATEVARTELDEGARPVLATHVENMEQYDIIYLGYPNWWGDIPMPVATFLEEYDFTGKTIIPFCTHEGSRLGVSEVSIARLVPDAALLGGFEVSGNQAADSQADMEQWLQGLEINASN